MNLKDAFLCIDCDEVFTISGSACNPRCPRCASSVCAPLSGWVQTREAFDRSTGGGAKPRLKLIHTATVAA